MNDKMFFGNKVLELKRPAFVMGIVNATPDSFYKSSRGGIDLALRLIDEGADILEVNIRPYKSFQNRCPICGKKCSIYDKNSTRRSW